MTDWNEMTLGDFDRSRAPKSALAAADAGQAALFPGTPTLPAKPAKPRQELAGQPGLFGDDGDGDDKARRPEAHAVNIDVAGVIGADGLVYSDADPSL